MKTLTMAAVTAIPASIQSVKPSMRFSVMVRRIGLAKAMKPR